MSEFWVILKYLPSNYCGILDLLAVEGPWKNEHLNEVLGRVNRQAAVQYKERIKNIVREEHGTSARLRYVTKRRVCGMAWRALLFIITNLSGKEPHAK